MRRFYGWIAFSFSALMLAFCWTGAIFHGQRTQAMAGTVSLRYEEPAFDAKQVLTPFKRLLEKGGETNLPEATLWLENSGELLRGENDWQSASVSLYQINGRGEDLWNIPFLQGSFPARGDVEGCAIDRLTADDIWGSSDVVGQKVRWGEKEYIVRGVFNSGNRAAVVQTDEGDAVKFQAIELHLTGEPGEADGLEAAQSFLQKMGDLPSPKTIVDAPWAFLVAKLMGRLPAWIFGAAGLLLLTELALRSRRGPVLCAATALWGMASMAVLVWGGELFIALPDRFIPTRWSDFAFWAEQWQTFVRFLGQMLAAAGTQRDASMVIHLLACVFYGCFASFAAVLLLLSAKPVFKGGRDQLAAGCGVYLVFAITAFLTFLSGGFPEPSRGMFLAVPCYLGIYSLIQLWNKFLREPIIQQTPVPALEEKGEAGYETE